MIDKTKIYASNGEEILIDLENYNWLSEPNWTIIKAGRNKYAITNYNTEVILMHRLIMEAKSGEEVDHRNHNGLDNRRTNLRFCTHAQNAANKSFSLGGASKYKGVSWNIRSKKWVVRIQVNNEIKHLGYFFTEKAAARIYDEAALSYFGEFAYTNEMVFGDVELTFEGLSTVS